MKSSELREALGITGGKKTDLRECESCRELFQPKSRTHKFCTLDCRPVTLKLSDEEKAEAARAIDRIALLFCGDNPEKIARFKEAIYNPGAARVTLAEIRRGG